jgi:cytoskeleton protein RodZ
MASIGAFLRELRTRRGVALDELARKTRVAPRYLDALERDAFNELPAPVFIRGFIRAYCQALVESPDEALARYDGHDGRTLPAAPAPPAAPHRTGGGESRPRGTIVVSFVLLVILGMALFTVALVIRPGDRVERSVQVGPEPSPPPVAPASEATPAAPPTAAAAPTAALGPSAGPVSPVTPVPAVAPVPGPVRSPTPPARPAAPSPAATRPAVPAVVSAPQPDAAAARPTPSANPAAAPAPSLDLGSVSAPYRLVARTSEPTWIRVRTEDGRTSEETVPAGEIREWVSDRPLTLTVGNAGGVSLELNGRALPPLGPRGVVVPRLVIPPDAR